MSIHHPIHRRDFFKLGLGVLAGAAVLPAFSAWAQSTAGLSPVSESDPVAKALGYYADAARTDTAKYPKRKGAEGAKQFCDNCNFYSVNGKPGYGKCSLIPTGLVAAKGWCNAWVIKAS